MAEKVTIMKLKVDLQCGKCYKKVKKLLCKFPQIRDQMYDEKQNIVTITVVCCNPEKIRDKLCCKGGGCIRSIEIVEPPKPKAPPKEPENGPKSEPPPKEPKEPEKGPGSEPPPPPKGPGSEPPPKETVKKEPQGTKNGPKSAAPKPPEQPVPVCPPAAAVPIGVCCVPCYEGRPGGPCFEGCFRPPPPPCYCYGYYGWPICDSYGGSRLCFVSRCDEYFSEENAKGYTII